jgi:hypothetical protein
MPKEIAGSAQASLRNSALLHYHDMCIKYASPPTLKPDDRQPLDLLSLSDIIEALQLLSVNHPDVPKCSIAGLCFSWIKVSG